MDNLEEFLGASPEAAEVTPEVVEAPQETAEPAEAIEGETAEQKRERDERGRFKAKDEPVMVPLQALHETRDEVKALKAELAKLSQPVQQPEQAVPDIFENPEGFAQYQDSRLQRAMLNATLNLSESMAKRYAGAETVEQAKAWGAQAFAGNTGFYQQFLQQPDPYGFLIEQHQRASTFAKLGDDPAQIEAFVKWREAQTAPPPAPAQVPVPTSLADAQSARGSSEAYSPPTLDQILGRPT